MSSLTKHKSLYQPMQIGKMKVKNKIYVPPMLPCLCTVDGFITKDLIAFAGRQAKSGAGIVYMGETNVDNECSYDHVGAINLGSDLIVPSLALLAEEVHRYGAKISIEINHSGAMYEKALMPGRKGLSPSPIPPYMHPGFKNHEVEIVDRPMMEHLIDNYVKAVGRCVRAGFDMVTIHCAHTWLLGQFLSPTYNTRTDEYGGNDENRMRFPLEVLEAVHDAYGDQINIDIRVSGSPRTPKELFPLEENFDFLVKFVKAATPYIDAVNVSAGFAPFLPSLEFMIQSYFLPHMTNLEFAERLKKEVDIPVGYAGSVTTLEEAEQIIAGGKVDYVGLGRPSLADDQIFVKGVQGRDDEIRPCLRCVRCASRIEPPSYKGIRCAVNPKIGREAEYPRFPVPSKKRKVMIIGGGPAGMEACQRCCEAGHEVVLYDKGEKLGGMLHVASALPFKGDMRRYMDWMATQCHKTDAVIHLGTEATPDTIRQENPDVVLVAIGGVPMVPRVPVAEGREMIWAGDVDTGKAKTGEKVVIVGAGLTGTETAIQLASEGKDVTVIDMIPPQAFLKGFPGTAMLSIFRRIQETGVKFIYNAKLEEVTSEGAVYSDLEGNLTTLPCDTVINAVGIRVENEKVNALLNVVPESYCIGDCTCKAQTIENAVLDAFTVCADL